MSIQEIPELDGAGLRKFGLMTGGLLLSIFGFGLPVLLGFSFPLWPWIVATPLTFVAVIAPKYLDSFYFGWMKISLIIGGFINKIILSIVFFILMTPIGLILRARGWDPMHNKFDSEQESYRVAYDNRKSNSFEKPF